MSLEGVSIPDVSRHGVLPEMSISSVNRQGVLLLVTMDAGFTVACVDRGVRSLSILVEDIFVPYDGVHGELVEADGCSVSRQGVVISVKALEAADVKGQADVSAVTVLEDASVTTRKKDCVLFDISVWLV